MAKRRGNAEGSITYRKKDKRWQGVITIGYDPESKPKRQYYYGKTRKEVQEKVQKALREISDGSFTLPSKVTFGEWIDRWLTDYKKPSLKPSTWESYKILVDTHIKPAFENVQLSKLKAADLQRFYTKKLEDGRKNEKGKLSTRYVRYMHTVIREALQQAVRENLIPRNPADATSPPKVVIDYYLCGIRLQTDFDFKEKRFKPTLKCSSLLQAIYLKLREELTTGKFITCKYCGGVMHSTHGKQAHESCCSRAKNKSRRK